MIASFTRRLLGDIAAVVYPPLCEWTHSPIESGHFSVAVEKDLLASANENRCPRCGANIGPHLMPEANGCDQCRSDSFAFQGVTRLGRYDGLLAEAILRMKRYTGHTLARSLAKLLFENRRAELSALGATAVVPVPHHRWTEWQRGYNPSQAIAGELAACLGLPVWSHALIRTRLTPPQHHLSGSQRRINVRGAFASSGRNDLRGARILLTDDVLTTGSTACESAKALRLAGASVVHVAVLAKGGQRRMEEAVVSKEAESTQHE
jgi:ComF family protein